MKRGNILGQESHSLLTPGPTRPCLSQARRRPEHFWGFSFLLLCKSALEAPYMWLMYVDWKRKVLKDPG